MTKRHYPSIAGTFRVTRLLGRGATSMTYHAIDERDGSAVALKLLERPAPSPQIIEQLVALRHPAIVPIWAFQTPDGERPGVVMPCMDGVLLPKQTVWGPLIPELVRREFSILAEGLEHAHRGGLVHGDVRPRRVIVVAGEAADEASFQLMGWDHAGPASAAHSVQRDIDGLGRAMWTALTAQTPAAEGPLVLPDDVHPPAWLVDVARGCVQGTYNTAQDVVIALRHAPRVAAVPWVRWGLFAVAALSSFVLVTAVGLGIVALLPRPTDALSAAVPSADHAPAAANARSTDDPHAPIDPVEPTIPAVLARRTR